MGSTNDVSVATITWARDAAEQDLLERALSVLCACGMPVAVGDAGTSPAFAEFLSTCPGFSVVTPPERSLIAQVQASLRLAAQSGRGFILYTESDKEAFFRTGLADFLSRAPREADVGVVLAARSDSSFATFPPFQQYTETTISELWSRCGAPRGDYSYGPLLLNSALLPHVIALDANLGWGWRHFVVGTALRLGYRIVLVEGDYGCPVEQREEDDAERLHRMRQLAQNLEGLVRSLERRPLTNAGRMASSNGRSQ